jgi:hypothetical protein
MAAWDDNTAIWDNAFGIWDATVYRNSVDLGSRVRISSQAGNVIPLSTSFRQRTSVAALHTAAFQSSASFRQKASLKTLHKLEYDFKAFFNNISSLQETVKTIAQNSVTLAQAAKVSPVGNFSAEVSATMGSVGDFTSVGITSIEKSVTFSGLSNLSASFKWMYEADLVFDFFAEIDYETENLRYNTVVFSAHAGIEQPDRTLAMSADVTIGTTAKIAADNVFTMRELVEFSGEADYTIYTASWGREPELKGDWVPESTVAGNWTPENSISGTWKK